MKHLWKKIAAGAAVVALTAAVAVMPAMAAVTLPSLPADQCVVDDAGVLSDSVTTYLDQLNGQLESSCDGAQIGVLTVQYTGSASTEEYALEAFSTWGIGSSSANNGVLILLVMESPLYADGDYYLTYGDGFRNTTLDRQASTLAQTMEDDFAAKNYDAAVETCADAVANTIADIYGVSLSGGGTAAAPSEGGFVMNLGAIVIALALLVVLVILVFGPLLNSMFPFCFGFGLGSAFRGPRYHHHYHHMPPPPPPYRPRGPRGPRGPRPPRGGGFGGGFGGGGFGGGGFGGMGGGSSHGGGGGRGR